ncbi:MAG: hypothetical protein ACKVQU_08390 [Burkholderiales bacterium]
MSVRYEDRLSRGHQPVTHDPRDARPVDVEEHPLSIYAKRITAVHNVMIERGILPTFDPIRRTAEEIDAMFAAGAPPDTVPPALMRRLPDYYERRVLAIEKWLIDQGIVDPAELKAAIRSIPVPPALG